VAKHIAYLVICCFLGFSSLKSQDTLNLMVYNLLKYSSTNLNKDRYLDLKKIVAAAKPDLLMVNELLEVNAAKFLLDSAINTAGIGTFSMATMIDGPDTDNMLYYRSDKVVLRSQKQILTVLRDISQYEVYKTLSATDTAFLYLHVAHLKAGNTSSDENQRNSEVQAFCNAVSSLPQKANVFIAGDFNFKNSSEPAWYTLTNACNHIMYDPINMPGNWNDNSAFSSIHTQSTRSSDLRGCCGGATGGLDDRFDFIMHNINVKEGKNRARYIPGTYIAYGNDNQRFNKALIESPANTIVSSDVAQALFNMSDHLPVIMKIELSSELNSIEEMIFSKSLIIKSINQNAITLETGIDGVHSINLSDMSGRTIYEHSEYILPGQHQFSLQQTMLNAGIYLLTVKTEFTTKRLKFIISEN
jgi:endonuclease/exonuclease/phosphatase family metal-dependent hydrolase